MASTPHRSQLKFCLRACRANCGCLRQLHPGPEAGHRSKRTVQYYHEKLKPFVSWLEEHGITELAVIRPDHIRLFLLERERAGRAAMTVHHYAACIKGLAQPPAASSQRASVVLRSHGDRADCGTACRLNSLVAHRVAQFAARFIGFAATVLQYNDNGRWHLGQYEIFMYELKPDGGLAPCRQAAYVR